jgi:hypothetical protein
MDAWLPRLLNHTPPFVKRQAVALLFGVTAAAFECARPRLRGLSYEQCLLAYATFTAERAGRALQGGDLSELSARLYRNAYRIGRAPGRLLRVRSVDDVIAVGRFLYGILDIDFQGSGSGDIVIGRCYFSRFYSADVCRLMSGMDRGLLAGLAGTGELVFSERITEGRPCCRARFALAACPTSPRFAQELTR